MGCFGISTLVCIAIIYCIAQFTQLCGDFNHDILLYDNKENTLNLLNSHRSQSLIPTITKPSRITDETATLTDNIFTAQPTMFVSGLFMSDKSYPLPLFILKRNLFTNNPHNKTQMWDI